MKLAFKTIQTETAPLPKSTIFWWSLINVAIFSSLVLVHFRDSSSSGKPGCFPDVPSRFLNCPEDSEHTKVVGVGDSLTVRIGILVLVLLVLVPVLRYKVEKGPRAVLVAVGDSILLRSVAAQM